jgi:hypothetical protein
MYKEHFPYQPDGPHNKKFHTIKDIWKYQYR